MKAMGPLSDMLMLVNDPADVVKLIEKLEGRMGAGRPATVTPGMFKVLERMYVPADYEELMAEFMKDATPSTASCFTALVTKIVRRRNWTWLLTHPELQDKDVHPTRRMHPCSTFFTCRDWLALMGGTELAFCVHTQKKTHSFNRQPCFVPYWDELCAFTCTILALDTSQGR